MNNAIRLRHISCLIWKVRSSKDTCFYYSVKGDLIKETKHPHLGFYLNFSGYSLISINNAATECVLITKHKCGPFVLPIVWKWIHLTKITETVIKPINMDQYHDWRAPCCLRSHTVSLRKIEPVQVLQCSHQMAARDPTTVCLNKHGCRRLTELLLQSKKNKSCRNILTGTQTMFTFCHSDKNRRKSSRIVQSSWLEISRFQQNQARGKKN